MRTRLRVRLQPYVAVLASCLAVTVGMVALRSSLNLATVTLVYLLLVFLTAVWGGRGPSVTASLLSFLASNYFFTAPYGTFLVASTQEVISLLVFLFVAEMTARLVTQLREHEAEARRRAWEASTLYALAHDMNASSEPKVILEGVASQIVEHVGVGESSVYLPDDAGRLRLYTSAPRAVSENARAVPDGALSAFRAAEPIEDGADLFLPLTVGEKVLGVLHAGSRRGEGRIPQDIRRMLGTFAAQTAAILERLRLQHEAAEAEALRKTDDLKSALLSAVSHDLRTPLASIRIAATGLQGDLRPDEGAQRELLEMIDTEAARLARLVSNLLDLSRIEAGVLRPDKEWRDLQEVIARAVDHVHTQLRGHRAVAEIPGDLPLVPIDFTQIEDVLVNLLDNAVRHSPEGTTIRITAEQRDREVVVQVENEGAPVPADAAGVIFERFYSVQRDRRRLGLGLAICKGLVEAHGGRIWVERPGEPGARFAFTLPLGKVEASIPKQP